MTGGLLEGRSQVFMFSFSTAQSELDIPIWSPGWRHHTVHTSPITKYGFLTVSACSICQAPGSFSIESQRKWNISRPSLVQDNDGWLSCSSQWGKEKSWSSLLSPLVALSLWFRWQLFLYYFLAQFSLIFIDRSLFLWVKLTNVTTQPSIVHLHIWN